MKRHGSSILGTLIVISGLVVFYYGLSLAWNEAYSTDPRFKTLSAPSSVPAMPGIYGWGADAMNACRSRALNLIKVSDIGNSGTGTFDSALNQIDNTKYNIIEVIVGGDHAHDSGHLTHNKECVYFAFHTAPGEGFQIRPPKTFKGNAGVMHEVQDAGNVLIVGGIYSVGDSAAAVTNPLKLNDVDSVVVAWTSFRYNQDQISIQGDDAIGRRDDNSTLVTMHRNLIGFTLQSDGMLIGNATDNNQSDKISLHKNVFTEVSTRGPRIKMIPKIQKINELNYDWCSREGMTSNGGDSLTQTDLTRTHVDILRNHFKPGPCSDFDHAVGVQNVAGENTNWDPVYHYEDNIADSTNAAADTSSVQSVQNDMCQYHGDGSGLCSDTITRGTLQATPDNFPLPDTLQTKASDVLTLTLDSAGSWFRLDCEGDRIANRDALDDTLVKRVKANAGRSATASQESDLIAIPAHTDTAWPCGDTDNDGMPDNWENKFTNVSFSVSDATDDTDNDGWWAIEEYLAGTSPDDSTKFDGTDAGAPSVVPTYHDSIFLYTDSAVLRSGIYEWENDDSIPVPHTGRYCWNSDSPVRVALITLDTLTNANQLDSARADSLLAAWARQGCDTASVKADPIP